MSKPSNLLEIQAYIHCGLCIDEFKEGNKQPSKIAVGWTVKGIQVWCERHNCNIMHMDFGGQKHHANSSRQKMTKELT